MEEEEAADEHGKYYDANSDIEVSPSPVLGFGAAGYAGCRNVARFKVWATCIFVSTEESPGDYTSFSDEFEAARHSAY